MVGKFVAYRRGDDTVSPEVVDRILVGACAAIWLIWLGVSVVAVVALVGLGRGFHQAPRNSVAHNAHTNWVLYSIIIVSAIVIAGAIPVLLRARRMSEAEPAAPTAAHAAGTPAASPAAQWSGEEVDRVWLRGTFALAGAMGVALIGAAVATYLMAIGRDGPSWIVYGVAGAVVAAMPVVEWLHVRQLRALSVVGRAPRVS